MCLAYLPVCCAIGASGLVVKVDFFFCAIFCSDIHLLELMVGFLDELMFGEE